MRVKLVSEKLGRKKKRESFFDADHVEVTHNIEDGSIEVEVIHARRSKLIKLPDDGDVIYLENDQGKTTNIYRPGQGVVEGKKEELRVLG